MADPQTLLTLAAAILGSNAVAVGVTLYFTRRRTAAETGKILADAHSTDADTVGKTLVQLKTAIDDWTAATASYVECQKQKAQAEIRAEEAVADNRQFKTANEMLTKQNSELQDAVTELRGKLREAEVGR